MLDANQPSRGLKLLCCTADRAADWTFKGRLVIYHHTSIKSGDVWEADRRMNRHNRSSEGSDIRISWYQVKFQRMLDSTLPTMQRSYNVSPWQKNPTTFSVQTVFFHSFCVISSDVTSTTSVPSIFLCFQTDGCLITSDILLTAVTQTSQRALENSPSSFGTTEKRRGCLEWNVTRTRALKCFSLNPPFLVKSRPLNRLSV